MLVLYLASSTEAMARQVGEQGNAEMMDRVPSDASTPPSALNRDLIGTSPAIRVLLRRASARERGNATTAAAGDGSQVPARARARVCACARAGAPEMVVPPVAPRMLHVSRNLLPTYLVCVHLPRKSRPGPVSVQAASEVLYASNRIQLDYRVAV